MSETHTRLETINLQVLNPKTGELEDVRAFLDHGSNRTFATTECAKKCGFQKFATVPMYLSSFGNKAKRLHLDVAKVDFYQNVHSSDEKIGVNVFIKDNIIPDINSFELSERQKKYIEDNKLILADPKAAENSSLKIDLLLGQDCVHSFTRGEKIFLPGGSVLVPSWDGRYILAGPLDCEQGFVPKCKPQKLPNFVAVNAVSSEFPFVVNLPTPRKMRKLLNHTLSCVTSEEEMEIIDSFRTLDALGIHPLEYEISPVLESFDKTTTYDGERYTVRLPFKDPQIKKLSNNFFQAFSRLMSGYKRRLKPKFLAEKEKYHESFLEDLKNGILEKVECLGTVSEIKEKLAKNPQFFNQLALDNGRPCCYLPHQAVYKQSTGKFRRVNDGKARPHKGAYSLNDTLEKGPDLMSNILHILIGFRKNKWAAKADIEKAFPQVVVHKEDRDALRCLWYEGDKIWVYRFARLPFGLSCSPMILAGTLQKHLSDEKVDEKTKQNFIASIYVDDSVWSEALVEELYRRKTLYTELFKKCGMNFRDWTSNHPLARKIWGDQENVVPPAEEKVLGMRWNVESDTIRVNSEKLEELMDKKLKTKRHLWRLVPSIYDPMGLLSPYVVKGKEIVSEACEKIKGWDSRLPEDIVTKAREWASDFDKIGDISWDRFLGLENASKVQLIGCCDASSRALGACVYLLTTGADGKTVCNLVMSKTRTVPKVKHSIPRLELLASILLVNVMNHVRVSFPEIPDSDIFWFSDSADVIFWLYSGHLSWRPFVANQVKKIRKNSLVQNWRHIDTSENPADLPSRGATLSELKNNTFWQNGPDFWRKDLSLGKSKLQGYNKHYQDLEISPACKAEMRSELKQQLDVTAVTVSLVLDITQQHFENKRLNLAAYSVLDNSVVDSDSEPSSGRPRIDKVMEGYESLKNKGFDFLMSVTDLVMQAASCFLKVIRKKPVGQVVSDEKLSLISKKSEVLWIQAVQRKYFSDIFRLVENPRAKVSASSRSLYVKHAVFLDPDLKVLRCATRNEKSSMEYSTVYPILLPSMIRTDSGGWESCVLSELLVKKAHERVGHQGVPNTLASLRSEYWVLKGRRFVQKILHKCVICRKVQGPFYSVPPSPALPEFRVVRSRPWRGTGLDYLGHFWLKEETGPKYKAWFILYTCGATRAIHLEAVKSRDVGDFLDGNSRFMNSRGIPLSFISDHEGSFKKGSELYENVAKSKRVRKELEKNRISWQFYTEKTPNRGGFIERMNALVKKILYKVLGRKLVSFEVFRTLAVFAASVINDRPLTYLFSDINSEYKALSPNMLLHGYNIGEPPCLNFHKTEDEIEATLSERYYFLEKLKNSFWHMWQQSYIKDLFERHVRQKKAQKELIVPKLGEIVLLSEEKLPRRQWRMGKIVGLDGEKRGAIRQCTVQVLSPTGKTLTKLKRPPEQLVPLEIDSSGEKFDVESLVQLEGDPRSLLPWSRSSVTQKYSKSELSKFKKAKVWPPYSVSQRFLDPSSNNTGPETDFISEVFKNRENVQRDFGPRKRVTFDFPED